MSSGLIHINHIHIQVLKKAYFIEREYCWILPCKRKVILQTSFKSQLSHSVLSQQQHIARGFQIGTGDSHRCSGKSSHLGSHFPSESRFSGGALRSAALLCLAVPWWWFSRKSRKIFAVMIIAIHHSRVEIFLIIFLWSRIRNSASKKWLLGLLLIFWGLFWCGPSMDLSRDEVGVQGRLQKAAATELCGRGLRLQTVQQTADQYHKPRSSSPNPNLTQTRQINFEPQQPNAQLHLTLHTHPLLREGQLIHKKKI